MHHWTRSHRVNVEVGQVETSERSSNGDWTKFVSLFLYSYFPLNLIQLQILINFRIISNKRHISTKNLYFILIQLELLREIFNYL